MEDEIKVAEVYAKQLRELVDGDAPPFLLDVRETWEVARGVIPGAVHIAMNTVPARLNEIPRDRPVVVYCAAGSRSYMVAAYMLENGFSDVKNLADGISGWAMSGGQLARLASG